MGYDHLGLKDWPFRIVPDPEFCDFLADRVTVRSEVESLLMSLESRPTSDIQLIWSWYGAGKTHTVYYLANRCSEEGRRLLPIYAELPRESSGFVDLYRATISQFPIERLIDAYLEHATRPTGKPGFTRALDPDLHNALAQAALGGRPVQVLLNQWLLGNSLSAASHRELGVGGRISTTEKCASILADVITLLAPKTYSDSDGAAVRRVLWIIDEVQRVESLGTAAQRSMLSGLVGVFNRCATGLTLLLSYTGEPQEKALPEWIPEDLADRIGLERPMLLPPLRSDEALLFVRDLLARFRLPECGHLDAYFPFTKEAIDDLVGALERKGDLKPRALMEALDASLRNLESQLEGGQLKSIGKAELRASLSKLAIDWEERMSKKKGKG